MDLQPYHVLLPVSEGGTAPPPDFLDRAFKEIGSWPTPAKIVGGLVVGSVAAGAVIALTPIELPALVVAGCVSATGVVGATGTAVADFYVNKGRDDYLKLLASKSDVENYRAYEGLGSLKDGFYIEHPHRRLELIQAKAFHEVIEKEQAQEILRFIRSQVKATSIRILSKRVNTQKVGAKRKDKGKEIDLSVESHESLKTLATFTYANPNLVESSRPFVWGHIYQELLDGLKNVSGGGTAHYTLNHIGSFSLNLKLAKLIEANIEYLNDRYLEVEITYV